MPRSWRMSSASSVVGPLAASAMMRALIARGVGYGDCFSSAARDENVAVERQQLAVINRIGGAIATDRAILRLPACHRSNVEARRVIDAAGGVVDTNDARALLAEQPGGYRAGIAETLHDDPRPIEPAGRAVATRPGSRNDPRPGRASTRPSEPPSGTGCR